MNDVSKGSLEGMKHFVTKLKLESSPVALVTMLKQLRAHHQYLSNRAVVS